MKPACWSIQEVANILRVAPSTVDDWIESGSLEVSLGPQTDRQVGRTSLVRFLVRRGEVLPESLVQVRRLLIIDDEAPTLRSLARLLSRAAPYLQVATADGPLRGLELVHQTRPEAVLVDFTMPDMGGHQVCEILRRDADSTPVRILAMSGRTSEVVVQRFRSAGAYAFLPKPIDIRALLLALNT